MNDLTMSGGLGIDEPIPVADQDVGDAVELRLVHPEPDKPRLAAGADCRSAQDVPVQPCITGARRDVLTIKIIMSGPRRVFAYRPEVPLSMLRFNPPILMVSPSARLQTFK